MLRRALTYQLILAVAVGPLLCCCSAKASTAADAAVSAPDRVPAERIAHACCSHRHAPAKSDGGQKPAPAKPQQPAEKCPCKDGSAKPQLQAEPTQTALAAFLRALALDAVAPFVLPAVTEAAPEAAHRTTGRCLDPSPTDELLYAHHKLRC
jgi:hypothetical protein